MKVKTLKWLVPIICYFLFIGLTYLTSEIQDLVFGQKIREADQQTAHLPEFLVFIIFFPLIPIGYVFIPFAQYLFRKSQKGFNIIAGIVILFFFLLFVLIEHLYFCDINLKSLFFMLLLYSQYCVPYFLILSYTLKKEKNSQIN